MGIGNSGVDGNLLAYPGQAAYTFLVNNTAGSAAPTPQTVAQVQTLLALPLGSSWARVTGSDVTRTAQTLADIAGLSIALVANAVYEFECVINATTTADTTGIEYGVQYSAGGAAVVAQITGSLTSTASKQESITALNTATSAYLTTSAQTGGVIIKGIVTTGVNTGNLTIQHLKFTSGTSTVKIQSYLKAIQIA